MNDIAVEYETFLQEVKRLCKTVRSDDTEIYQPLELSKKDIESIIELGDCNVELSQEKIDKLVNQEVDRLTFYYLACLYPHPLTTTQISVLLNNNPKQDSFLLFSRPDLSSLNIKQILNRNTIEDQNIYFFELKNSFNKCKIHDNTTNKLLKMLSYKNLKELSFEPLKYFNFNSLTELEQKEAIQKLEEFLINGEFDEELYSIIASNQTFPEKIRERFFEQGFVIDVLSHPTPNMCKIIYESNVDSFFDKPININKINPALNYIFNSYFLKNINSLPLGCLHDYVERYKSSNERSCAGLVREIVDKTRYDDLISEIFKLKDNTLWQNHVKEMKLGEKSYKALCENFDIAKRTKQLLLINLTNNNEVKDEDILKEIENKDISTDLLISIAMSPLLSPECKTLLYNHNKTEIMDLLRFKEDFMKDVYNEDEKNFNLFTTIAIKTMKDPMFSTHMLSIYPPPKYNTYITKESAQKFESLIDKHLQNPNVSQEFKKHLKSILFNFNTMKEPMFDFKENLLPCFTYELNLKTNLKEVKFNQDKAIELNDEDIEKFKEDIKKYPVPFLEVLKKIITGSFANSNILMHHPQTIFTLQKSGLLYNIINQQIFIIKNPEQDKTININQNFNER